MRNCFNCGKLLKKEENSHLRKCYSGSYIDARYKQILFDFSNIDLSYINIYNLYHNGYSLVDFKNQFGLAYRQSCFLIDYYKIERKSKSEIKKEKIIKYKNTCIEKYGISHSTTSDIVSKIKKTCTDRFGSDNIFKNDDFIKKSILKKKSKYGKAGLGWINENDETKKVRVNKLHNDLKKWWLDMDISEKENRISILKDNRFKWWNELSDNDRLNFIQSLKDNYESKLERRLSSILSNNKVDHKVQYWINRVSYDIQIENKLLEVNGDFWHCNPSKYTETYLHPYIKKTSKDIWENDRKKKINAEKYGFSIFYIWEEFINKSTDAEIFEYIKVLMSIK